VFSVILGLIFDACHWFLLKNTVVYADSIDCAASNVTHVELGSSERASNINQVLSDRHRLATDSV
jgi:hypothetical protein